MLNRIAFFLALLMPLVSNAQNDTVREPSVNGRYHIGVKKKDKKEGLWQLRNKEGRVLEETNYSNGEKDGRYTLYFSNDSVQCTGEYKAGKADGVWIYFILQGDTSKVFTYEDGVLHGYSVIYSDRTRTQCYYRKGKINGWYIHHTRGADGQSEKIDSTFYTDGKKDGRDVGYKDGKLIRLKNYSNDVQTGKELIYYEQNGQLARVANYVEGKQDGAYLNYTLNGIKVRSAWFRNGEFAGYDTVWDEKGRLQFTSDYSKPPGHITEQWDTNGYILVKRYYINRNVTDTTLTYWPNGNVMQRSVPYNEKSLTGDPALTRMGKRGKVYTYNRNGTLASETAMFQGTRDGLYIGYDSTGREFARGKFFMGNRDSVWVWKTAAGVVIERVEYKTGTQVGKYAAYYPDGKPKLTGICRDGHVRDSVRVWARNGNEVKDGSDLYSSLITDHFKGTQNATYLHPSVPLVAPGIAEEIIMETEEPPLKEETIYSFAESMPNFPGGQDSLIAFFARNLVYPAAELNAGKEGTVYVYFVVEKNGAISDIRVVKGVQNAPGFSTEAIRLISIMPKWIPGTMNNQPVRVSVTMPVKFVLR